MGTFRCGTCGREHGLGQIEPSFRRPDAYLAVPREERQRRVNDSDEGCLIASADGQHLACFVRAILKVPITDEKGAMGWGLPGVIRLTGPRLRPALTLAPESAHPFAVEARTGVPSERTLEWRSWFVHP
jgi:hypothetical protein